MARVAKQAARSASKALLQQDAMEVYEALGSDKELKAEDFKSLGAYGLYKSAIEDSKGEIKKLIYGVVLKSAELNKAIEADEAERRGRALKEDLENAMARVKSSLGLTASSMVKPAVPVAEAAVEVPKEPKAPAEPMRPESKPRNAMDEFGLEMA